MKLQVAGVLLVALSLFLTGCASTYDMKEGGESFWGGGYLVEEESASVFHITAKTNVAQWSSYSTARQMWEEHARKACGDGSYIEKNTREYEYEAHPRYLWNKYIVTVKEGQALCQKGG